MLLFWREEKPSFSNAQKANCNAEIVTTFSRHGCSIWNALGLILSAFKEFCLDACSAHQQVWSGSQTADRKLRHTQWLSPRQKSCFPALLWQKPAQKYLCFPACIFCLCYYNDTRSNADVLCTFLPTCSVGSSGSGHPMHGKSMGFFHAWKEGWSTGSFSYSTQKLWEGLENPFPAPTPCTVCLLLAPNTPCSLLEELPLFTSSPSLHKKPFFCVSSFSGGCEKRAGSPNSECWRLHDQQQQELQFPVSEVLAMSTITGNTLFGYSNCQNFKPSPIELVPFHKLIIQSYWINSHMDGKIHVQAARIPPTSSNPLAKPLLQSGKTGRLSM